MNLEEVLPEISIASVELKYFKAAFKPAAVPLGLFNVIIGRNGSGKSTLLEAMQWVDSTLRRDAREASDRTFGVADLINQRAQAKRPEFRISTTFAISATPTLRYEVAVGEDSGVPVIRRESLTEILSARRSIDWIRTTSEGVRAVKVRGGGAGSGSVADGAEIEFAESDRLALGLSAMSGATSSGVDISALTKFWSRAVFLRLSPSRLADGSPVRRKSFEPILDEEGQNLPALLNELSNDQREELVAELQQILPGIRGVDIVKGTEGRDSKVYYSLKELMPYRGRSGKFLVPIPAWMLSEGTRRITAILALLKRRPSPSLICIEELENGLDPWTVQTLLGHLMSAAERGVQIVLSTHSPWVLDHVPLSSILYVRRADGDTEYLNFAQLSAEEGFSDSVPAGTRYTHLSTENL